MDGLRAGIQACLIGWICVAACGCGGVTRELTIKTAPSGALVELNDEQIGVSPVSVSFNWYGDYRVRVSKSGYETLNTHRRLKAPWYDGAPFDFIGSFLWPRRTVDTYEWTFELTPVQPASRDAVIEAAQRLESEALVEFEKPVGAGK